MVRLVDYNNQEVPNANAEGIVVNMINTSLPIEEASYSVRTGKSGKFESEDGKIKPGLYKIEAGKTGYITETMTVQVDGSSEVVLDLKKIPSKSRRSHRSSRSDHDKIVNPGEVNIQPPSM
ncbi:MAG: hypothetical protein OEZ68_06155 [Gammaproteobacteria bacterium]|nr:hypothetical protein [Gammaproteobacteria bacterium]MDH5800372.1 hypothetical protein [Gammaproteobacteria bacterium]